jgi:hypothetical protein
MRVADVHGNGPDMHIAVMDVPAIRAFGIAAAGELGHGPFH